MAIVITPPKRVCDICGKDMTTGPGYQFPIPSLLLDNKDAGLSTADTGYTDVCPACCTSKGQEIVDAIIAKAKQT
jgi:hypothetical protein